MEKEKYKIPVSRRMYRLPLYLFGQINDLKYQKRRAGIDIIDLGMGNPNDFPPAVVIEKLKDALDDKRNHRYSVSIGIYNLRREVARFYARHWNVKLDPEKEVICTIGSKEGISHMCLAMLGPGDTALVPLPAFPIHIYSTVIAGANVIGIPMFNEEGKFVLLENIVDTIGKIYPKPKLLFLNFPHNPTTAVVDLDFYKEVYKIAKKNNLYIIHDFAYALTVFDDYKAPSFLQVRGAKSIAVEFTTMSKPYNMAGWRVGYCTGNSEMIKALAKIKGYYDYGMFQAIQIASIIALRECDEDVKKQALIYQKRRDVLCGGLNRIGWKIEKPKATMFVWAKIPERFIHMGSMKFAMFLMEKANVAVAPGIGFGEEGEGYVRLAIVENEERLRQAVQQIKRAFKYARV